MRGRGSVLFCATCLKLVSARSSFFLLILSFRPSASLLAAVILACICSEVISADMIAGVVPRDSRMALRCASGWDQYSRASEATNATVAVQRRMG